MCSMSCKCNIIAFETVNFVSTSENRMVQKLLRCQRDGSPRHETLANEISARNRVRVYMRGLRGRQMLSEQFEALKMFALFIFGWNSISESMTSGSWWNRNIIWAFTFVSLSFFSFHSIRFLNLIEPTCQSTSFSAILKRWCRQHRTFQAKMKWCWHRAN